MTDAVIVVETAVISGLAKQLSKAIAARRRPFVRFRDPSSEDTRQDNESFFSGHTTLAFAVAAASGTVAALRRYEVAPALWVSGLTLATVTGYLRIAADRHYFTDVLAGALTGAAIGVAVPFFHRREGPRLHVTPSLVSVAVPW